jgi:mannonate dehydratase
MAPQLTHQEENSMKLGMVARMRVDNKQALEVGRQLGVTHIRWHVAHAKGKLAQDPPWDEEEIRGYVALSREYGMEAHCVENFYPSNWCDILTDGPEKEKHYDQVARLLQALSRGGIKMMGYNFSLTGVWGRVMRPEGRGGASVPVLDEKLQDIYEPAPDGFIWGRQVYAGEPGKSLPTISDEELWQRFEEFLKRIVPVAEENGVILAAHPDDPPLKGLRGQGKLVTQPEHYDRLLSIVDSPNNRLELCLGTLFEMDTNKEKIYDFVARWAREDRIGYIHLRNVIGTVPRYREAFIDAGDTDIPRLIKALHENGYRGAVFPDHNPVLTVDSPHASLAFSLGYIRALLQGAEAWL